MNHHLALGKYGGWIPDHPDKRDHLFGALKTIRMPHELPAAVNLIALEHPIDDQGKLGSCTAQAGTATTEITWAKARGGPLEAPDISRMFVYYNARLFDGDVTRDSGSTLRATAKALAQYGCPFEANYPYETYQYTNKPPAELYHQGEQYQITQYMRLDNRNPNELLTCLADGYSFMFGISVYNSFMNVGSSGLVPMPHWYERMIGGHALCATGYDREKGLIRVRNSWGTGWGDSGYCWFPFSYLTDTGLSDDFWTVRAIENVPVK